MLRGLARLVDQRVAVVTLRQPGLDLELEFEHGLRLAIFCDQVNEVDKADNYVFFVPQTAIAVGTRSIPHLEPREL